MSQPSLGRDLALGLRFSYKESDPDVARWANTLGVFSPSLSFPVSEYGRLALNYRIRNLAMEVAPANAIAGSLLDAEAARGDIWESSIGYKYIFDTRGVGLDPNSGIRLEFGQDFGVLGGDYEYIANRREGFGRDQDPARGSDPACELQRGAGCTRSPDRAGLPTVTS